MRFPFLYVSAGIIPENLAGFKRIFEELCFPHQPSPQIPSGVLYNLNTKEGWKLNP